jgi:hypothetical protein
LLTGSITPSHLHAAFLGEPLGTADSLANDFTTDIFNYAQPPTTFVPFNAPLPPVWFLTTAGRAPDDRVPDDDTDAG